MTFQANTIERVEDALVDVLAGAGNLTGLTYEPFDLPSTPTLTLWGPDVERPDQDEPKGPLGSALSVLTWTVRIYLPLIDAKTSALEAKRVLGLVIGAVEDHDQLNAVLGGLVIDQALVSAELLATDAGVTPALLVWELRVSVLIQT